MLRLGSTLAMYSTRVGHIWVEIVDRMFPVPPCLSMHGIVVGAIVGLVEGR